MKRDGFCGIGSLRHALANNKYIKNDEENLPDSYAMHYDINSMYSYIPANYKLPYDEFSYLTDEEIRDFNIWDHDKHSDYGYILCVDISEIDIKYHDYFLDLPIFPYRRKVYKKEISEYQKQML